MRGQWKCFFLFLGLHRRISADLKVFTNADTTLENVYTVKLAWKFETAKKNKHFCWDWPWATFSIDPGILISLYASAHRPYKTLAIGEQLIFWPGKDSPVEVGSTECSCHLVFQSFWLLPATWVATIQFLSPPPLKNFLNEGLTLPTFFVRHLQIRSLRTWRQFGHTCPVYHHLN